MALTVDQVGELLRYTPETGEFIWLRSNSNRVKVGQVAGCLCKISGYRLIGINGRVYKANRIAYLLMVGEWPDDVVDHANGEPSDDRWSNLRLATRSQNCCNTRKPAHNTSGFKGVVWSSQNNKWQAKATKDGKSYHFGFFDCPAKAAELRQREVARLHGDFARHE